MKQVAVHGALGKMGRAISRLLSSETELKLKYAYDIQAKNAEITEGLSRENLLSEVNSENLKEVDVVIDFSIPEGSMKLLKLCKELKKPIVIGTTGFSKDEENIIKETSRSIPILRSSNMSIGVNMLFALVEKAAQSLKGRGFQPEMMEIHHKRKIDSPSGTARTLEEIILNNMQENGNLIHGREGIVGARTDNEIGSFALRGGDVVGDHTVFFLGDGERLELKHQATNRDVFARGAISAAEFLVGKEAGIYSMADVLNL